MTEHRCPQPIFDLYDVDPSLCFKAAFEWVEAILPDCQEGDIVIVPAKDGGERSWIKGRSMLS